MITIATLGMMIVMSVTGKPLIGTGTPLGILDMEFAIYSTRATDIYQVWATRNVLPNAINNTYWDFLFLLCYGGFFYLMCTWLSTSSTKSKNLFKNLAYLGVATALLDVFENILMLRIMNGYIVDWQVLLMSSISIIKWLMAAVCVLFILLGCIQFGYDKTNKKNYTSMKLLLTTIAAFCTQLSLAQTKPDVLATNIDRNTAPSQDFFQYANGGWIKNNPIPASESSWGIGQLVQEEIYKRLLKINEQAAKQSDFGGAEKTAEQKIGLFWKTAMDSTAQNKAGLSPLKNQLKKIDQLTNLNKLLAEAWELHKKGIDAFFGGYISQDDKNSEEMAYFFFQSGLGMPNREYYFKTDSRTIAVQKAYKSYLVKTLTQLQTPKATQAALEVYNFEKKLAQGSRKMEDLRDPYKNYNKKHYKDFIKTIPQLANSDYAYITTGELMPDSVIVGQPEFFTNLSKLLKSEKLNTLKHYLKVRLIQSTAQFLDDATFMHFFNYRKSLTGASTPRPRWKRVLDAQENVMGELLGQLFAKEYFDETAKNRYTVMVEAIKQAYATRIKNLDWMSDATKQKALDKLQKVGKKVGYPDKWKDFGGLYIDGNSYVENIMAANLFWHKYAVNKLGKPVDRTEWQMTPQTYNAYYSASNNEIVLPAGIFAVPGFKDEELDDAFVYGYAGASTIGHEITHGFDDQGRQYDAKGNLADWWTPKDAEEYIKRTKAIIQQYNEFIPVDTMHVNGEVTQGENIADLGGMILGLEAFKNTAQYKEGKTIAGLTPLQRYFLGYAFGWMYHRKKESLANQIMTDVHSPERERVNGPVVNIEDFYKAFDIKLTDKMYRAVEKRVQIW
jgi:putative endopeptidase